MANVQHNSTAPGSAPVFGNFFPLNKLWDDNSGKPLFPSEHSARWFVRANRSALAEGEAIALFTGRMLVDPARCAIVAEKVSINMAKATVK